MYILTSAKGSIYVHMCLKDRNKRYRPKRMIAIAKITKNKSRKHKTYTQVWCFLSKISRIIRLRFIRYICMYVRTISTWKRISIQTADCLSQSAYEACECSNASLANDCRMNLRDAAKWRRNQRLHWRWTAPRSFGRSADSNNENNNSQRLIEQVTNQQAPMIQLKQNLFS